MNIIMFHQSNNDFYFILDFINFKFLMYVTTFNFKCEIYIINYLNNNF